MQEYDENELATRVIELANAALEGEISIEEWETLVDSLDEKKG